MAESGQIKYEVHDGTINDCTEKCDLCESRQVDGYCSPCEINVCNVCFKNHLKIRKCRDHVLLKDADKDRLQEKVTKLKHTLDSYKESIDKHSKSAETINKDIVLDVESFGNSIVEYVAGSKQQVLDEVNMLESAQQNKLDKFREDLNSLGSQIEEMLTEFMDEDLLHTHSISVETIHKVAVLQNVIADIDCNNVVTKYTFRPSKFLKYMMSSTQPIGRLSDARQIEDEAQDDDDIKLKTERERNQLLQQQLDENQKMISKLNINMYETYDKIAKEKQSLEQELCNLKADNQKMMKLKTDLYYLDKDFNRVVKEKQKLTEEVIAMKNTNQKLAEDKQALEQEICTLKADSQGVAKDKHSLAEEVIALKDTNQKVVKDKQVLEQELRAVKADNQQSITLSCGHDFFGKDRFIECTTCGIFSGDQPNGTFDTRFEDNLIELLFTFPSGIQSKLHRNPGRSYSGKTVTGYLRNDATGNVILKMLKIAFQRRCVFTVDDNGTIVESGVEIFLNTPCVARLKRYKQYVVQVIDQLEEIGIKKSDVA